VAGEFKVMRMRECPTPDECLDTPEKAVAYWREHITQAPWYDPDKEAAVVLILNTRRRIMGHALVTLGLLDTCLMHPREVFRPALAVAGHALIFAHNHPSGDPTPSEADIKSTRDMIRAGQLLRIEVLDSLVIGTVTPTQPKGYASLRELGYFYS
jgi:DNA repair protein RadC